jgi:tetratricopeptide (TPR) repeat protein
MAGAAQWLPPDAWIDVCGAHGLRQPYRPRGSEETLARVLASDPRRVAAVIAPPGAGASRLCLELARSAPRALYPDPRAQPDPERAARELTHDLAHMSGDARPVVVLDGPSPDHALAALPFLASRRIHPRLLVLVPADPETAGRLPVLSGLSHASLIAVAIEGVAEPPPPAPDALLPFVLADHTPADVFPPEELLREQGWLIDAWRGVLARVGARARRALIERLVLAAAGGAGQLGEILDAAPTLRRGALASILRFTGGEPADDVLTALLAGDDPALLDADALARQAIPASARVLSRLADRAGERLAAELDEERAAMLSEILARDAARRGQPALDALRDGLARARSPGRRARLLAAIAWITKEERTWQEALAEAARDCGPTEAEVLARRAHVLARRAHALELDERPIEAMACAERWLEAEEARESAAGASAARMRLAALARSAGAVDAAVEHARRAQEDSRAVGDVRAALTAVHFGATLLMDAGRFDEALRLAQEALAIAEAIGDAASIGWARYVLGAGADRAADPATAQMHYEAAIAAWSEAGHPIPERLQAALAVARAAAMAPAAPVPEPDTLVEAAPAPEGERVAPSPKPGA